MNRKEERVLIRLMGIWQIIDGLITILVYGTYKKMELRSVIRQASPEVALAMNSFTGSMYMVAGIFGAILIGLGIFHIVCSKRYVRDNEIQVNLPIWLFICGIFSYFIMDILSMILSMAAAVILLAKNKGIRQARLTKV